MQKEKDEVGIEEGRKVLSGVDIDGTFDAKLRVRPRVNADKVLSLDTEARVQKDEVGMEEGRKVVSFVDTDGTFNEKRPVVSSTATD